MSRGGGQKKPRALRSHKCLYKSRTQVLYIRAEPEVGDAAAGLEIEAENAAGVVPEGRAEHA